MSAGELNGDTAFCNNETMKLKPLPKVVYVARSRDGVLIEFADGNAALYSASLLAEVFSRAVKLEELNLDEA